MMHLLTLCVAIGLDRVIGDPPALWSRLPHPVVLFGAAISALEKHLNTARFTPDGRRLNGVLSILLLLFVSVMGGAVLSWLFHFFGLAGFLFEAVVAAVFIAQKSLGDHVQAVARGLKRDGVEGGRLAVSMIVGRDPKTLDGPGVCRAAIESLSENFADGVVAPAFWYAIAGLPGLLAYKMLNTADSMIGHKNERYIDFGWASARLDDLANWPAARISALLIALAAWLRLGWDAGRMSLSAALRDHGLHRSPNSGWPEAAMAGALDLQLAGPRIYGGVPVSESMMHAAGRGDADHRDITRGVEVFYAACDLLLALVLFTVLLASF
uniref:adenosylcobinamide-phosphate synthase CbiB n=1 Tax=uncultured Rhizobium sp. TaxID=155567 RepID=UPI00260B4760|nr:adenosylcobinamide-phosphate synthase CbiB [uncultured Rhizobium sp.]